ncbi:DJ-1/PfpI family protein [Maridesulfovibrio sp.]|uniref:DJ-1/PfpI family protein n=1 Tax=Maridesulfovibrio sp. TaxID=2795000 RepID=UPI0039F0EA21
MTKKRTIGVVLFEDFELLDVFGPLEMFGIASDHFHINMLGKSNIPIASKQGPKSVVDSTYDAPGHYDILLIPGGQGTRREVDNCSLLDWLKKQEPHSEYVISVCTGSALLAKAGLLNGLRATTNKRSFDWATRQGPKVNWQQQARWVEDGKFFTSSGISAGIDMSLALIHKLLGKKTAEDIARRAEYIWNQDANYDPFARLSGTDEMT